MEKINKLSDKEILQEFIRISTFKKTHDKPKEKVREKKKDKTNYKIFIKPKKPEMKDYLSIETLNELHDWIKDKDCRQSIKRWVIKYSKDDTSTSDYSSSDEE